MASLFDPTGSAIEIRRRISEHGPITFAEFMETALYWPDGGYYASRRVFGPSGDFYTAPLVHPAFGALITRQLIAMWRAVGSPRRFTVIEAGAGNGRLAMDITAHAAAADSGFAEALEYTAVDLRDAPAEFHGRWVRSNRLPTPGGYGVVLANELFDAMPVHRVTVERGALRELFVDALPDGGFTEVTGEPSTPTLAQRFESLGVRLSEGYRAEVNLGLGGWLTDAFGALACGYLLLIDYGHEAVDQYAESRRRGTLRCYSGHTLGMNPYANVGRQDISVHVELTSLRAAAAAAGFAEAGSMMQAELLAGLGIADYRAEIERRAGLSPGEREANLVRLAALEATDGMGGFKALAFAKDAPTESVLGVGSGVLGAAPLVEAERPSSAMPTWEDLLR